MAASVCSVAHLSSLHSGQAPVSLPDCTLSKAHGRTHVQIRTKCPGKKHTLLTQQQGSRFCSLTDNALQRFKHRSCLFKLRKAHPFGFKKSAITPVSAVSVASPASRDVAEARSDDTPGIYDAIVIGSGIGGTVAATQLAIRNAKVVLLEKYVIPGGSAGFFERDGYIFDVGSSVMFGFGSKGNVNLITRSLAAVGRQLELIEDPTTVHYHMPNGLSVKVHRSYEDFIAELTERFPHEKIGLRKFYDECWIVFNALNSLELKSLEEPLYLLGQFVRNPLACLTLGVN